VQRQDQRYFRTRLLAAYGSRCAVTGTAVPQVLQVAHIDPYEGMPTNVVSNGILLRADIHDLFDQGLVWITDNLKISVQESLHERIRAASWPKAAATQRGGRPPRTRSAWQSTDETLPASPIECLPKLEGQTGPDGDLIGSHPEAGRGRLGG
jgi:HNH endonuclease